MLPMLTVVVSLALVAIFATRHFSSIRAGAVAAILLASMPLVWLAIAGGARQVVLVPFVLALLLGFDQFYRSGKPLWLAVAGAAAAAMLHAHQAGVVMAPIYLAAGAVTLLARRDRITSIGALVAGFAVVAAPWAIAVLRDPTLLTVPINAHGLYDADRFNVLQGMREITSWVGLTVRSEVYWDSFSPALLFLGRGDLTQSLIGSTVFLAPFAVPLVRGLLAYVLHPRDAMDYLVLGTFVAAPAAVALLAQPPIAPRLILLAPAAAIIATRGCYPGAFRTTAAASPPTPAMAATAR